MVSQQHSAYDKSMKYRIAIILPAHLLHVLYAQAQLLLKEAGKGN